MAESFVDSLLTKKASIEATLANIEVWLLIFGIFVVVGVAGESVFGVRTWWNNRKLHDVQRQLDTEREAVAQSSVNALRLRISQADARALEAKLELARLTAPTFSIPVINGVAIPDLSKGLTQRVLLTTDVMVLSPILTDTQSGTFTWTLFLDQDERGSRIYSLKFVPDLIPLRNLLPNTRTVFEFVTDKGGHTSMRGMPVINRPLS